MKKSLHDLKSNMVHKFYTILNKLYKKSFLNESF